MFLEIYLKKLDQIWLLNFLRIFKSWSWMIPENFWNHYNNLLFNHSFYILFTNSLILNVHNKFLLLYTYKSLNNLYFTICKLLNCTPSIKVTRPNKVLLLLIWWKIHSQVLNDLQTFNLKFFTINVSIINLPFSHKMDAHFK